MIVVIQETGNGRSLGRTRKVREYDTVDGAMRQLIINKNHALSALPGFTLYRASTNAARTPEDVIDNLKDLRKEINYHLRNGRVMVGPDRHYKKYRPYRK